MKKQLSIRDFFEYFDPGCPYHLSSMAELQEAINEANPEILQSDANWFRTWSQSGKRKDTNRTWIHPWYQYQKK